MPAVLAIVLALLAGEAIAQAGQSDPFQRAIPRDPPSAPAQTRPAQPGLQMGRQWLVGRWEGDVVGLPGEMGTWRILTVERVEAGGRVVGTWAARGRGEGATIRVDGDTVSVLTSFRHTVTLRRTGPNVLQGAFVTTGAAGRSFPVTMTRR
jgi:hypothetical protein